MSLITTDTFAAYCDALAAAYTAISVPAGVSTGAPVPSTARSTIAGLQATILGQNDVQQEVDLLPQLKVLVDAGSFGADLLMAANASSLIQSLRRHCANAGGTVDASINDIPSYLASYNGGIGHAGKFNLLLTPDFATLYLAATGSPLPAIASMSPALQPDYNSACSAHGMADYDLATTTYTKGTSVNTALYQEAVPLIEVITSFSGGSAPPTVAMAGGTNDLGGICTWSAVTLTGNNPAGPLSGVTVTPAIATGAQTVALSSTTGIIAGSVVTINAGAADAEVVSVASVGGGRITATFRKAHASGATVSGWNTYAANALSAGSRLRSMAASGGIVLGLAGHTAGKVRVVGRLDRVAAIS